MKLNDSSVYFAYLGIIGAGPIGRVPGFFSSVKLDDFRLYFIAITSAFVIFLRLIFQRYRQILIFPTLLLFGFIAGVILAEVDTENSYDPDTTFFHEFWTHISYSIYGFYIIYFVDLYAFRRNALQVLPLSLSCLIFHLVIVTGVVYPMMKAAHDWPLDVSFSLVVALLPDELTYLLEHFTSVESYVKDIRDILQSSEVVIYATSTFIALQLSSIGTYSGAMLQAELIWTTLSYPFNLILSLCVRQPLKYISRRAEIFLLFITISLFMSSSLSRTLGFYGSGPVVCTAVVMNMAKVTLTASGIQFVKTFWESLYMICSYIGFIMAGFIIGSIESRCAMTDLGFVLAIYLACYFARFIAIMISTVFIIRQGNQITWKHIKVAALGVSKGSGTILAALYFTQYYPPYKYIFLVYSSCIVCLSLFFNGVLVRGLLRIEGMYDLTRSRIVNMNGAMFRINQCRERSIFSSKMNIIISDANWWIVDLTTRIRHPYGKRLKGTSFAEDLGDTVQIRFVKCGACGAETLAPLTKREFEVMLNDAKLRIMKTQMVSYFKQHEQETLSIEGLRYLINLIELAFAQEAMLFSEDVKIQSGGTRTQLALLNFFQWIHAVTWMNYGYIPKSKFRKLIFSYATSHQFRIIHTIISFIDIALNMVMVALFFVQSLHSSDHKTGGLWLQTCDLIFCVYFVLEFTLQVLGIGFVQYFSQLVNVIEFNVSVMARPLEVILALHLGKEKKNFDIFSDDDSQILFLMKFLQLLRLSRLYVLVAAISPQIVTFLQNKIKNDIMRSYDIGKAYLMSIDRVSRILATMVNNDSVLQELRKMIELERINMSKELGLIQRDIPSIAVTLKTRHAIRSVINTINDCLSDMKEEGILDSIEHKCLLESLEEVKKELRDIHWIEPCPPDFLLSQIPWLSHSGAKFFLHHAELQNYDFNDVLIRQGDDPVGIFILVSGLLKCIYKPSPTTIQLSNKFGVLPNYDFFSNTKFAEPQEEIAVTGNVIGEIGLVTGRRYDMTVTCDTAAQAYFVPWETVRELAYLSLDSDIIQARIWKTIGVRIGISLLEMEPHFQNWERTKLLMYINRGIVPILNHIQCLNLGDFLDDVIIIEGIIMDRMTRMTYFAPLRVPRTVHRVLLPEHPLWDFHTVYETKLLVIPDPRLHEDFIFSKEALFQDHFTEAAATVSTKLTSQSSELTVASTGEKASEMRKRKAVGFSAGDSHTQITNRDTKSESRSSD